MALVIGIFIILGIIIDILFTGFYPLQILFIIMGILAVVYSLGIFKCLSSGKWKKAFKGLIVTAVLAGVYIASVQLFPGEAKIADMQIKKAEVLVQNKDYVKAFEELNKIYVKNPENIKISNALGELYMEQGRDEEARKLFQKIVEKHPENMMARYNLAKSYEGDRILSAVEQGAKYIIASDPHFAPAYEVMGDLRWNEGDMIRGIFYYRTAVREDPKLLSSHIKLGDAYRKTHSYGEALEEFKKAEELADSETNKEKIKLKLRDLRKEIDENTLRRQAEEETKAGDNQEGEIENEIN